MKLKVKETFFDKKEDRYIIPCEEPIIERPAERAKVLIGAGVVEEVKEEPVPEEPTEAPKPKKKAKKNED